MYLHNLFWISLKDLFNKMSRLFFLSLGVAVGTCALIFLLCLHSGLKKVILDEIIQKLPFNQLKIRPISQKPKSLVEFTFKAKDESLNLVREKLDIIQSTPGVKDIWPERTLNFPILFTLKEVKVSLFTVPDITMPTTIFGVHPDLLQNNPELYRKFKYNPDPNAEVPIVCSSKLFEMMNDTSLAQGKIGDLLSSIINENTFLDKPMTLRVGFSTKDEQRISEGFERAKQREDRIRESEIAGIAKFMRSQLESAISEGYEADRPWFQRKARIIGFTDEVPVVGLSVPLAYVEEWLKIRSEYELDHYCGAVIELKNPLPPEENARKNKMNELKKMFFWEDPPLGVPETRIQIESDTRIRVRQNPFLPASSAQWFQSHVPPLSLSKPRWNWLESQNTVEKVFWEQTLDFPAAMRVLRQKEPVYLPTDLHGIDPELLGEQASLLQYNRTGNDPVPAIVSPYFFQRLRELGMNLKDPDLYAQFQNLETLKQSSIFITMAYDPMKFSMMEEELQYFIKQEELPSKPQFIFRELHIVGVSNRVPDIGISVPKAFLERAYRWKYPQLKTEEYKYSGVVVWPKNLNLEDTKATQQLEKGLLSNFQMSWNDENKAYLQWIAPDQLNFRHFYWKPSHFENFLQTSAQGLELRGGSFASFEFKEQTNQIYLERKSRFPVKLAIPDSLTPSPIAVTLVGIDRRLIQDTILKESFSQTKDGTLPLLLSPLLLEKLQQLQLVPEQSPWKSLIEDPQKLIGKVLYLGIGDVSGDWNLLLQNTNALPPAPIYDKDETKIKRTPFVWKAKIVGISLDASPAGISIPDTALETLIRWYFPTKVYENYSGVTVITKAPEDTATVAKQIREHPSLKLDILTETETAEMLSTLRTYLIIATIIIGVILFLVAAVSIFNGLTLSVLEQSKKIGIYRAIGAKRSDIIFVFMVEAIAVGLIGGGLGTAAGLTAIYYVDPFIVSTVPEFSYKNIKFWDTQTGREIHTLSGQPGPIHAMTLSYDGVYLATGSSQASIRLWDFRSKGEIRTIQTKQHKISSLLFSKDAQILISGGYDTTLKFWDALSGQEIKTLSGHRGAVHTLAWAEEQSLLASGSFKGELFLWNHKTGELTYQFPPSPQAIYAVTFSPDGKLLACAGEEGIIRLFDVVEKKLLRTFTSHKQAIHSIAFSPQGQFLASGSLDHDVKLWDITQEVPIQTFNEHNATVWTVTFSPDGKILASGGHDKTVKIRNVEFWTQKERPVISSPKDPKKSNDILTPNPDTRTFPGHTHGILSMTFSPNGRILVTGGEDKITFFHQEFWFFFWVILGGIIISIFASVAPSLRGAHITPADVLREI